MNALDALRRMVANYPGGRAALATRLNKSDEVLRKELSGVSPSHKMGLADAEEIASMCREAGSAEAHALGTVFSFNAGMLALPEAQPGAEKCLSKSAAIAVRECADVLMATTMAKADNNVSDNDKRVVQREIAEAVAALLAVQQSLDAEHAADSARSGR